MNDGDIESHLILTSNSQEWVLFNTDKKVKEDLYDKIIQNKYHNILF